ncbi:MAG TPA: iron chelate uptake ABC transporter family permease subunit, partial [Actinophytocola sp.]|nr:iron chelate uptake ABC transporter family permease subunit [Actinophytocola sp.]
MTALLTPTEAPAPAPAPARRGRLFLLVVALAAAGVAGALVHLTQGTSAVGAGDVLGLLVGASSDGTVDIVVEARLPRLLVAVVVGVALGLAGAVLQSVSRNIVASPDTLAVNAGAHLAIVTVAAFGVSLPLLGAAGVAFLGGLGAAALVLVLSGAGGSGSARLVLAGTAIALAMVAMTTALLLLFTEETNGLYAWGQGSLDQNGLDGVLTFAPLVGAVLVALLMLSRRMDLVYVGDDHARALGVAVTRVRASAVVLAVLVTAAAVVLAGPIGFVGLAAPALVRLLASGVPGLHRHAVLLPVSAAAGAVLLIGADVLIRALIGSQSALEVPTGVVTTILGAVFLVGLARTLRVSGSTGEPPAAGVRTGLSRVRYLVLLTVLVAVTVGVVVG